MMSKLVSTLTPDVKKALIEGFTAMLEVFGENGRFECEMSRGTDEVTQPGEHIERFEINETGTFILKVNGGTADRVGVGMARFLAKAVAECDGEYVDGPSL